MKKLLILILGFIVCGIYVGYTKQRNDYKNTVEVYLETACSNLLLDDFGEHISLINIRKTPDNVFVGSETTFDIKNNILSSYIEGRSFIYFNNAAPQEITCKATLLPIYETNRQITKNTQISFRFNGPRYLPASYKSKLANSEHILTIDQIQEMFLFGFLLKITEKPPFQFYGIL